VTTIALVVAVRGEGPPSPEHLGYAALAGAAGAVGLAALYRGLAVGSMSVVAPISATAAVVPVVFGVLTGERPSPAQGIGIALPVVGVVLASRSRGVDGRGRAVAEGAGLALVAALAFGLLLVALGEASEGDALWATLGMRAASFSLVVVTAFVLRPSFALAERDLSVLVLIGILDTAGKRALRARDDREPPQPRGRARAALSGGDGAPRADPARRAAFARSGNRSRRGVRRRDSDHRRVGERTTRVRRNDGCAERHPAKPSYPDGQER
jgi:hypothetical protein